MTKLKYKSLLAPLTIMISMISCSGSNNSKDEGITTEIIPDDVVEMRQDQIQLAGIETGFVELRTLNNTLKVNGIISVAPQNQATVCMPQGGFVKYTSLLPGSRVSKGQTLAIIENQDFVDIQQNYLEARNKLIFAEAEYKRHTDLYQDEVYSQQNLQEVTVEYKNTKALVKSFGEKLKLIGIDPGQLTEDNISNTVNLISPIDGFLKSVNVNIGKYVSPTDVLFEIINSDKLLLDLTIFEKDADKVLSGQKIKFFINNETEAHEGVVSQTGKSVSRDKTFNVFGTVTSSCKNVLPGMYVNAFIEQSDQKVTALPAEAIVSFDDKEYIFVFDRNKEEAGKPFTEYKIIEVKKGISSSGYVQVTLPEGFDTSNIKVVVKGAYNLLSAMKNAGEMAC